MERFYKKTGWVISATLIVVIIVIVIPDLTFGAIKTIGPKTRAFLGAGVGGALYYDYYYHYDSGYRCNVGFGIPFEGGFQFNFGHCNVLAGFQYVLNTKKQTRQHETVPGTWIHFLSKD